MIIAHAKNGDIELRCNQLIPNESYILTDKSIAIDLLNIFLEIYVADISIKRVSDSPRNIQINTYVDAKNHSLWKENLELIERLANFVTEGDGDRWQLNIEPVEYEIGSQQLTFINTQADNISLLSGGLDSFCGAYHNEIENRNTLYCGYKTSNVDTSAINCVYSFLKKRIGIAGMRTYSKVEKNKVTYTQRTRSLLFFSLAIMTAIKENIDIVNINENGIMTLNPSFQSRGTTKTTHPKTIHLYQTIMDNVGIKVQLNHPFLFTTKGEMVNSLSIDYKKNIINTRSCSRSMQDKRYDVSTKVSCGTCVPCLLRKISMSAYDLEEFDNEYEIPYVGDMNDDEYRSSLNYYTTFYQYINSDQIFSELDIKRKYYHETDYYERTYKMLNKFSSEFEVFARKYIR
ncbi:MULTISPECIES: hypothetical protein [unclassified Sedimentibacter]|uniref:hypothetical protein n=1 Tax=unclassified Sedimentibacter TaxID=2649220 RepID=UPI0027DF0304|nr:hypothetical protein [Sedimentibacter sp. MB35-C1]WMJ77802.1 hypothetical protein RBQ61_02405 [Sedimentibacter sp. MB35-C1]